MGTAGSFVGGKKPGCFGHGLSSCLFRKITHRASVKRCGRVDGIQKLGREGWIRLEGVVIPVVMFANFCKLVDIGLLKTVSSRVFLARILSYRDYGTGVHFRRKRKHTSEVNGSLRWSVAEIAIHASRSSTAYALISMLSELNLSSH